MKQILLLFSLAFMLIPKYADAQCAPDVTDPQAVIQDITVFVGPAGTVLVNVNDMDGGSFDICSTVTLTYTLTGLTTRLFSCADIGFSPIPVSVTVTDVAGNTKTATSNVTVIDTVPPVARCAPFTAYLGVGGSVTVNPLDVDGGSTDNCGPPLTYSLDKSTFDCSNIGTNDVWLTVTDAYGFVDSCQAVVTVVDTVAPVANCAAPGTIVYLDATGSVTIDTSMINNGSTDNCGIMTVAVSNSVFTCDSLGIRTVYLYVTDSSGNSDTCMTTVDVRDTIAPDAQCTNLTVYLNSFGKAYIDSNSLDAASSDACGIDSMWVSRDSFDCGDVNLAMVTMYVRDSSGNIDSCESNVFVLDTIHPVAICQTDTVYLDITGTAVLELDSIDGGSWDTCGIASRTLSTSFFTCDSIGVRSVSLYVTDPSGNADTCVALVTVLDTLAPDAKCIPFTANLDSMGGVRITPANLDNGSSDNCGIDSMWISADTFSCVNIGDTLVWLFVRDSSGNMDSCSSIVTVVDGIAPTAICKDITVYLDANGGVKIDSNATDSISSDNCSIDSIWLSIDTFTCADIGPNTVTMSVRDTVGNISTCTSTVTVLDTTAPVANCNPYANPYTVTAASYTTFFFAGPLGPIPFPNNVAAVLADSILAASNRGDAAVNFVLTDASMGFADDGNAGGIFNAAVLDSTGSVVNLNFAEGATIFLPFNALTVDTFYLGTAGTRVIANSEVGAGSDNCTFTDSISKSDYTCADTGSQSITYYVTDGSGNIDSCTKTITILDTIPPSAICMNAILYLDSFGMVVLDSSMIDGGSFDNCSFTATISKDTFNCDSIGIHFVNMVLTDASGNKDSCLARVEIKDTIAPITICKDTFIYLDATGKATVFAEALNGGITDNCYATNIRTDTIFFTCADIGDNMVILTATDSSGNVDTCHANVEIRDSFPPTARCIDTTIYLDTNGMFTIDSTFINNGSSDVCMDLTMSLSATTYTCDSVGVRTVTLYVSDLSGNMDSCTASITVLDTIKPIAICKDTTIYLDQTGVFVIDSSFLIDTIIEPCGYTATLSATVFTCDSAAVDSGRRTVSLYVEDASGNKDTCSSTVTVLDTLAPIARCRNAYVFLDSNGDGLLFVNDLENGSTDNCGIDSLWISKDSFDCGDLGTNNVTLSVRDIYGNIGTCVGTVFVYDVIAPSISCKPDTIYLDTNGMGKLTVLDVLVDSFENCNATIYLSDTSFDCSKVGVNSVKLTIKDESGRDAECFSAVTVLDTLNPIVACNDFTVYLNAIGSATIIVADVDSASTDNCAIATRTISRSSFTCADTGEQMVTLIITDVNGNIDSCTATVTVRDTMPPLAMCQNVTVYLDSMGGVKIDSSDIDNGMTDNCGIATITLSNDTFRCVNVGMTNTITVVVTDVNGNSDSCTADVTVIDNIAPIARCKDTVIYVDSTGNIAITAAHINAGSSDNCEFDAIISDTTFNCTDTGVTVVQLYVTDASGNLSVCTSNVTIYDTIVPSAVCKNITVNLNAIGQVSITAADVDSASWDNCSIDSMYIDVANFTCADTGANPVVLTIVDPSGNTSACTATVTVVDVMAPTAICQDIIVYLDSTGNVSIDSSDVDNGSSDNCGILTMTLSNSTFNCTNIGSANTVTLTVTDVNGNIDSCTSTVTVIDNIVPTAVCKSDTIYLDNTGNATITTDSIDGGSSDNCAFTMTVSQSSFTCTDTGMNSVTLTVTDSSGNVSTCVASVFVYDTTAPMAMCQDITVNLNAIGEVSITAADINNGSNDNCSIDSMYADITDFTCADTGNNPVVLTVVDPSGNTSTCTSTVRVVDAMAPIAICRDIIVYLDATGNVSIDSSDVDNGSSDNCGIATMTLSTSTFNCTNVGGNTVTLTVTDVNGIMSTCTSTVTVVDNIAPTAVCKNDTVYLDATGNVGITTANIDGGSTDNCTFTLSISDSTFGCADTGLNTVTLYVTDASGNVSVCTGNVMVYDTLAPMAMCQNITVNLNAIGEVSITAADINNGSNDNCSIDSMYADITDFTCADTGDNPVVLTVVDPSGNTSTCTSTVRVVDAMAPIAICRDIVVFLDSTGNVSIDSSDVDNGSSDNCGILTMTLSTSTFNCTNVGANTVTLTVTDVNGNVSTCTSTVTVVDNIAPTAVCKSDTVYLDASGSVSITTANVNGGSSDNCTFTMAISQSTFNCTDTGMNSVTLSVTDASGNLSTCVASVLVLDTTAPMAMCQDITINLNAIGEASITAADINNGSSDNCSIDSLNVSMTDFTCADTGANTVTLTVVDPSGNTSTCTSTVTVVDAMAPTAICQDIIVYLDATGNVSIDSSDVDNGSSDNCGILTMTLSTSTFNCTNVGGNTVTLTVTDVNGNVSTCTSTVTVVDNIAPTAVCKDDTVYLDASGNVTITTANVDGGSSDNCTFSLLLSDTTFNCTDTGANTVTLYVTDASGNVSVCTSTITVYDTTAPIMMCKDDTAYLDAAGQVSIMVSDVDNGTTDNCTIESMVLSNYDFTCADTGINMVTLTATDVSGNVDSCMSTVTVLDTIAPMAMCKDITVYLDASGMVSIDSSDVDNGSTDNCEIATIAISKSDFNCSDIGANIITVTVTDVSGNSSICTSTVTVLDTINPVVTCKDTTIYLDSTNLFVIDSSFVFDMATDNCAIDSVWLSKTMFTCADLGVNNVIVYASDSSGNVDSCTAVVTLILLNQPITDTIAVQVDVANYAQICLTDDRLLGTPSTYTSCKAVTRGNLINYNDTCFTYTQTSGVKYLDTACIIICDDCGICDTTVLIFVPTPSVDTFHLGPVVPVSNVDTCVTIESTFMTGMFINTCDSTSTSSAGVPVTITGACVRYFVPSPVFTGDTVCMIVCDTIHGLSVCDTTMIIYMPDTTPPTVICKDDTVYLDALGTAMIDTSNVVSSVTDNTLINSVSVTPTIFNCAHVGPNSVTVTAIDTNRNSATCTATVTVLDTLAPIAICQNITIQLDSNGNASIVAADVDGGSTDNCGVVNFTVDKTNFDCSDKGANTVTLVVTDRYGNSSTCTATVTVEDNIAPAVFCRGDKDIVVRNTTCEYIVEDFISETSAVDNCGDNIRYIQSPEAGTAVRLTTATPVTITITAIDSSSNESTCTFMVTGRCSEELDIPQFFSPNGDGVNDTWEIPELAKFENNTVKVFNRWGTLVFEQKGYYTGWNGSTNVNLSLDNKMLPEGTYYYIIDLGVDGGTIEPYTGYIQIKR